MGEGRGMEGFGGVTWKQRRGRGPSVQPGRGRGASEIVPVVVEGVCAGQGQAGETTAGHAPQTTWEDRERAFQMI